MTVDKLDTAEKALTINLNSKIFGTLAEIGAGQEVSGHFFRVGAAAKTIAKTMSAYDMNFSDAIYGKSSRYVARERLLGMLDHEYSLLIERLGESRGAESQFFVFADTVATRTYKGTEESHGWVGIRFQLSPMTKPNDIIIHLRMLDKAKLLQQRALGVFGVNLIYGAFTYYDQRQLFIQSLVDNLGAERIEVDMIEFLGPFFEGIDNRLMTLRLVQQGLTNAIMFGADRKVLQPAEALYEKPILFQRGTFKPITNVNLDMMRLAREQFLEILGPKEQDVVVLLEITINNLLATGTLDEIEFLNLADTLCAEGYDVLISNYPQYYHLASYFRRYTTEQLASVIGANSLVHIFDEKYYEDLSGGILEAFGGLFGRDVTLFVYPMTRGAFDIFLQALTADEDKIEAPNAELITAENIKVGPKLQHLYAYLWESGYIRSLEGYDEQCLGVLATDILAMMQRGDPDWTSCVPKRAAEVIKNRGLFGLK